MSRCDHGADIAGCGARRAAKGGAGAAIDRGEGKRGRERGRARESEQPSPPCLVPPLSLLRPSLSARARAPLARAFSPGRAAPRAKRPRALPRRPDLGQGRARRAGGRGAIVPSSNQSPSPPPSPSPPRRRRRRHSTDRRRALFPPPSRTNSPPAPNKTHIHNPLQNHSGGGTGGGQAAKDALGNDVKENEWLAGHPKNTRELTQGLKGDPTYLIVNGEGKIESYGLNAVCTHLGCVVPWVGAENKFKCPCHGSQYNAEGKKIRGPAPLSLALAHCAVADSGLVTFSTWTETDFRTGLAPWWK